MKVNIGWVVGLSIGNLISFMFVPDSDTIKFFNSVCNLLIALYIIQNQQKLKDSDV